MKIIIQTTLVFSLLFGFESKAVSQNSEDSIKIFFVGAGKGEKFRFYNDGRLLFEIKTKKSFKYDFSIPKVPTWKSGDYLPSLIVTRKGPRGLFFRDTFVQVHFDDKRYLIIKRNPSLKNRFAIEYEWGDVEPKKQMSSKRLIEKVPK
jgi:hypothetical protein